MKKALKSISVILTVLVVLVTFATVSFATEYEGTTTDYRYENRFNSARILFGDFSLITEDYFAIPGLENTELIDGNCNCMTPQGLCVTEEFVFISAYCNVKNYKADLEKNLKYGDNEDKFAAEENHVKHNSVIYILSSESGELLKTLVLPDSNHVGGLASDGENLFVAKSTDKQVSIITSKQIDKAMGSKSMTVSAEYDVSLDCDCTASFVTYYDGILWVGVFNEKENGELNGFTVDGKFTALSKIVSVEIHAKANGACFAKVNDGMCLAVNSSYGRKNPSKIYLYSVSDYGTSDMALNEKDKYTTPPTVQNSCVYDGRVYYIYESAATCYSQVDSLFETKSTTFPIDRVCIGEIENLFNWHCENLFLERVSAFVRAIKVVAENIF